MYDGNDAKSIERYSSAVTLSDMEVFIFPELMLALFLANIMSPRLWLWRSDPWFSGMNKMNPQRRIQRLKQYIMDHFAFNLDLDTWGLTTKQRELARFAPFIGEDVLSQSNALFGYEGDKYYFDIDIRKHFGLDKYTSDVIPYWKTETLEAMEAFRFKEGYSEGAGECVSLAALYAASAFVVGQIPLDDIFMMATPLHSQNFLNIGDGIITNNRRIVSKTMWFNGTELSAKARRALENERVTIVAHHTGFIHTIYDTATINQDNYRTFKHKLSDFLKSGISFEILANFLRQNRKLQSCFQIAHNCCGKPRFIEAEKVYQYEHSSKARVGSTTQALLLHEIEEDEFYTEPLPNRIMLGELESFFKHNKVFVDEQATIDKLKGYLVHNCFNVDVVVHDLIKFCRISPHLPQTDKIFQRIEPCNLEGIQSSEEALAQIEKIRESNPSADLAFSAFRDLKRSPWKPFLKAALERNPVCIAGSREMDQEQIYQRLQQMENVSIYDGPVRLAQPDEVWNYSRGDGLEKAICFLNVLKNRDPESTIKLWIDRERVFVNYRSAEYIFKSSKQLNSPLPEDFS